MDLGRGCVAAAIAAGIFTLVSAGEIPQANAASKPNILFFILDDVGIDQLKIFGNGGLLPAHTPNLRLIAKHGVKFTNVWAMPECSPSRAALFTGRYALRTGVDAVIVEGHLPQTHMSSFEATVPRVLGKAGYASALVGKYHLGDAEDPAKNCAPAARGFQFFNGTMKPGPPSVDTTAGGVDNKGRQVCGYFQTKAAGACYTAPGDSVRCTPITAENVDPGTDAARTCLQRGGIFVPNKACRVNEPKYSDFSRTNAYYVWERTTISGALDPHYVNTNNACPSTIDRTYMTEAQGNDGADWWKKQQGPRMLTVSFNSIHTPMQKPPTSMVPDPRNAESTCSNLVPPRDVLNMMIESVDVEIGRVLAQLGLGTLAPNGRTLESLRLGNTMVVIIGDNGSQGAATRLPFNIQRAKGTVYQTGIWVPLIFAGRPVVQPGRTVDAMVNAVDLYKLFGDVAGVRVESVVPPSHVLDSRPMLPYLVNPNRGPIRKTNFAQLGVGTFSPDPSKRSWPCMIGNTCNDTLVDSQALCENDNGGTWYGPGGKKQLSSCCAVEADLGTDVTLAPVRQYAVRGGVFRGVLGAFKLVELRSLDCSKPITNASQKVFPWQEYQMGTPREEFYDLTLDPNMLDNPPNNLAKNCAPAQDLTTCLPTAKDVKAYKALKAHLQATLKSANSQNRCTSKGDGNLDQRITEADLRGWEAFKGHGPSVYDINRDGRTNEKDRKIIEANLGLDCMDICARADLNRDGRVNAADMQLLSKQSGKCEDDIFCGGDLDGNGRINNRDVNIMTRAQKTCASQADAARKQ
jgi:hypothetical protein